MNKDLNKKNLDFFPSASGDNNKLLFALNETSKILCKWFSASDQLGPFPTESNFKFSPPEEKSAEFEYLFKEINNLVQSSFNPSNPGSLAHLDPPPLTFSIIGDLIAAGLNNNLLANELSPSISLLEKEMCEWFATKLGFKKESGGIAASGGTLNNLNALVSARYFFGLESDPDASFVISKDAHVSFKKCARILGIKIENIIIIETDEFGRMDTFKLEKEIIKNQNIGKKIFAVVATMGTTIRGAIDPLSEINQICKRFNIWFHIDGSIGGIFSILKRKIKGVENINKANSITINPQKVLGITKTSSLLIVKEINSLKQTFHTGLPYLDSNPKFINRGELGVQGSRPAEIIKLWLGIKFLGLSGIEEVLNASINKKILLENNLNNQKFDIYSGPLHIISFVPKILNKDQIKKWTYHAKDILIEKNFMLSRPYYQNKYLLRAVLGNFNTKDSHILELAKLLNKI
tara:strand:- start:2098 stop:3486 length:1389 start_codon:yes stop_codon:yes gene_type:complete